jgi:hypothetical protein
MGRHLMFHGKKILTIDTLKYECEDKFCMIYRKWIEHHILLWWHVLECETFIFKKSSYYENLDVSTLCHASISID